MVRPRPPTARRRPGRVAAAVAALALVAAPAGAGGAGPAAAQGGERISDLSVDLRVDADGTLHVSETVVYDFGGAERHGIVRDIPVRLRYDDTHDRIYPLTVTSVQASPGTPAGYEVTSAGRYKRIRIGDPDRTISGVHTYTVAYRVRATLNGFADHDELYWNATGDEWNVPIDRARVQLRAPATLEQVACFAGPRGSALPCASSTRDGPDARFAHPGLGLYQGLTVVAGFPKGVVPSPRPELEERWTVSRAFSVTTGTVGAAVALLVVVLGLFARLAWKTGRDRRFAGSPVDVAFGSVSGQEEMVPLAERPVTPVEFAPPDKLRPGQVGTLIDERANPLDVIATIVDLAVRGYLRIEEIPKTGWFGKPDWTLTRLREPDGLRPYERLLLDGLFEDADGDEVRISELKNTFAERLGKVQEALYDDAMEQKWFHSRPDHARTTWTVVGALAVAAGAGAVVLVARFTHWGLVPIPLVIGGLLLLVSGRSMPRRTATGTSVLRRVMGFRRFIDESEAERARFAERQNLFSEYLPYAIVFGATEKWARAFAGLDGELPEVSWYGGTDMLTASSFSSSMDSFTVTSAGTITSTPSGSGSSGFGGGGSSGGGGGGGGGGSW